MSLNFEYLFLLLNRTASPVMVFAALYVFLRTFDNDDVTSYLLAYSAVQWGITAAFQWQKNVYVQTYGSISEGTSLTVLIVSSILFSGIFFVGNVSQGFTYSFHMTLYCLTIGLIYYFGIALRMRGATSLYVYGDTISTLFRWGGATLIVIIALDLNLFFLFLFILGLPLCVLYLYNFKKITAGEDVRLFNSKQDFMKVISLGFFIMIYDFSSSGMMYIDRFFVAESDSESYLLHATVGTQISSIVFGAFISSFYPRLKSMNFVEAKEFFFSSVIKMTKISLLVFALSIVVAPFVVFFLGSQVGDYKLLFIFSVAQMFHYFAMLIFGFYTIYSSFKFISFLYLSLFLLYLLSCYLLEGGSYYIIALSKVFFMSVLFLSLVFKFKKDFVDVEKSQA